MARQIINNGLWPLAKDALNDMFEEIYAAIAALQANGGTSPTLGTPAVTIDNETTTSIESIWNAVPNATNYTIYRGTTNVFADATLLTSQTGLSYSHTGLNPSTTYYVFVVANAPGYLSSVAGSASGLTLSSTPSTFDYYLDSSAGSDSNDGLTEGTAKATVAAVLPLLTTGKKLGIKSGSAYFDTLYIANNNVEVGIYGGTTPATMFGIEVVSAGSFTKTGGLTNVYEFQATPVTAGGSTYPFSILEANDDVSWEQRTLLRRATSQADCDAKPGSMYVAGITNGVAQTIYIHPIGSTNPTSDGKYYTVAVRDAGIDVGGSGVKIDKINVVGGNQNDGPIRMGGATGQITNCKSYWGTKHNFFVTDGCLVEDCEVIGTAGIDSMFIGFVASGTGTTGITYNRCRAIGIYPYQEESTKFGVTSGWFAHTNDSNHILKVDLNYCYGENLGNAFGSDATTVNIKNCSTKLCGASVASAGYGVGSTVNIEKCFFDQRTGASYQKGNGAQRTLLNVSGTVNVKGNVFLVNPSSWSAMIYSSDANTVINIIQNSFVSVNAAASFAGIYKNGTGLVTMDRNIFYGIQDILVSDNTNLDVASDNNVYYRSSGALKFREGATAYDSYTLWQGHGEDLNALNENPGFWDSPADWLTRDWAALGNSNVLAKDAGALEFV